MGLDRAQLAKTQAVNVMLLMILDGSIADRVRALECLRRSGFETATPEDLDDVFEGVTPPWDQPGEVEPKHAMAGLAPIGRVLYRAMEHGGSKPADGHAFVVVEIDRLTARRVGLHKRVDLTPVADLDRRDCLMVEAIARTLIDEGVTGVTEAMAGDGCDALLDKLAGALRAVRQGQRK